MNLDNQKTLIKKNKRIFEEIFSEESFLELHLEPSFDKKHAVVNLFEISPKFQTKFNKPLKARDTFSILEGKEIYYLYINKYLEYINSHIINKKKEKDKFILPINEKFLLDQEVFPYFYSKMEHLKDLLIFELTIVEEEDISMILSKLKTLKNKGYMVSLNNIAGSIKDFELMMLSSPEYLSINRKIIKGLEKYNFSVYLLNTIVKYRDIHMPNSKIIVKFIDNYNLFEKIKDTKIDYIQGKYIKGES